MTPRELFNLTRKDSVPDDVMNLADVAAENAADTVGHGNRFDASGRFTDAFVASWFNSVVEALSTPDMHTAAAAAYDAGRILRASEKYGKVLRRELPTAAELAPYLAPLLPVHCMAKAYDLAVENFLNDNRARFGLPEQNQ